MSSPIRSYILWFSGWICAAGIACAGVKVGERFPALSSFGLEGALPDQAGRVVLVDFWATWCAPCKASFPAYSALQREFGERGLTIIAVSVDQKAEPFTEFVKKFSPAFATVRDGAQKLVGEVRAPGMPTCYLIDRKGVLREIHSGYHGDSDLKEIREKVVHLLEEKP